MDLNQLEAFLTAQTKKQGGITADQAAVIAKFWKNHRTKIRESLINQSRWDNTLKNMNWRVDLKSQSRHVDQINTPVAIVEMELGKNGQLVLCHVLSTFSILGSSQDIEIYKKLTTQQRSILANVNVFHMAVQASWYYKDGLAKRIKTAFYQQTNISPHW